MLQVRAGNPAGGKKGVVCGMCMYVYKDRAVAHRSPDIHTLIHTRHVAPTSKGGTCYICDGHCGDIYHYSCIPNGIRKPRRSGSGADSFWYCPRPECQAKGAARRAAEQQSQQGQGQGGAGPL